MFLTCYEIKNNLRSSMLTFVFWASLLLLSSFRLRTKINEYNQMVLFSIKKKSLIKFEIIYKSSQDQAEKLGFI